MKKINILLAITFISIATLAQDIPDPEVLLETREDKSKDLLVLDFHNDLWLGTPDDMELREYALGFNIAFMAEYPLWEEAPLHFAWGLGFSSHNVHHNGQFEYLEEDDFTEFHPFPDEIEYDKNKLSVNYFEIPVELRLRSKKDPYLRFYAGFKGGVMFNVHSKLVDGDKKYKVSGLENTARFRYGPTVRIGIKKFGLYGFYSLSELFEPGEGVELIPVSFGISLFLP